MNWRRLKVKRGSKVVIEIKAGIVVDKDARCALLAFSLVNRSVRRKSVAEDAKICAYPVVWDALGAKRADG